MSLLPAGPEMAIQIDLGLHAALGAQIRKPPRAVFLFLYFLKIKILKIYVRFEIFQKYPLVAPIGRQALSIIFFLQIRNEIPGKKRPCRPPTGDRGLSPSPRATAGPSPRARQGGMSPPSGDRGIPLIKAPTLPFNPHLSPKIPPKIQKKREE